MKNIYLVQANYSASGALFLPYSAGTVAAYSFSHQNIQDNYCLKDFIIIKSPVSEIVSNMQNPFLVGFSSYLWNIEYNLVLAKAIKQKWPECLIAFGGPQIPNDLSYLEQYPFIDILMHGEGEVPFFQILSVLADDNRIDEIPNISVRIGGTPYKTEEQVPASLDSLPSPYLMGLFDNITNNPAYQDVQFNAVLETNRGCPYGCIYCCWARSGSSFRQFSLSRVRGDLEWMAKHRISYCMCADSNFGILDRDREIAQYVIELNREYGFPEVFETTAAKNKDDTTFKIIDSLEKAGLNRGVSIAVQSMSPEVLRIIGRKETDVEKLSVQLDRYRRAGIYTYTDVILGLPGETLESYCRGLFSIIEAGQHYCIAMYRCEFLPNTIMYEKEFVDRYNIKTIRSRFCQNHEPVGSNEQMGSRSEIVVGTSTMSSSEWKTALKITACAQSFHCMGMLRFIAIYLRKAKKISYYDFYMSLFSWIENDSACVKKVFETVFKSVDPFLDGKGSLSFSDKRFGDIYWPFEEGVFLCCCAEFDDFFADIRSFAEKFFDDTALFEDLFAFQKAMIARPYCSPITLHTEYDWKDYFDNLFDSGYECPEKKKTTLKTVPIKIDDWETYAREIVWYGKRKERTINKMTVQENNCE